ncbi:MAG: RtcB family protein [Anaerolineales bacterium]|nr:RtcB family protein [Anaerolineales bacterium]MDW8448223.1 RtcB family protein [Anaerolineales bacterium]
MVKISDLVKISDYEWEIPKSANPKMQVPVRIFATRRLLEMAMVDESLQQAVNSAMLPGLVGHVLVMPDMHQGYGFPIGGVAATRYPDGVISPGGIGYDINCGVRLLASQIDVDEVAPFLEELTVALDRNCPSGVGKEGHIRLTDKELDEVCIHGSRWALKNGYATQSDLARTEESGCVDGADPQTISKRARERGRDQLGTLGAGNHFLEVDLIEQIFDPKAAEVMGLKEGCIAVQIHCGSRGFGHQICSDYVDEFQGAVKRYGIQLPDRELVCAPLNSPEGQRYLKAMRCAANFAFANRQILAYYTRRAFEEALAGKVKNWHLHQVYDIAHNMGKIEVHEIDGERLKVCVHRKGATRAFGPGFEDLPPEYRPIGQPVLVPGSMGTASWVLLGTEESTRRSFASTCHGAGRTMSRAQAKKKIWGEELRNALRSRGIHVRAGSLSGLAEEAPEAYKDVDDVVETVVGAGIARKVARLVPLAVVKG